MKKILFLVIMMMAMTAMAKDLHVLQMEVQNPKMHCEKCENRIKDNIRFEKGVKAIETDVPTQTVIIRYDADKGSQELIVKAMKKLGYTVKVVKDEKQTPAKTLQEAAGKDLLMCVAVSNAQIGSRMNQHNQEAVRIIGEQFGAVVAENCMKPGSLNPAEGVYRFELADKFVNEALARGQKVIGHNLVWHSQTNDWIFRDSQGKDVSAEVLKARLKEYITTVVSHFKGRVFGWDVVNEALNDNGTYRKSAYYRILGEEYFPLVFQYAHEADPDAQLYYNDYSMYLPSKVDGACRIVRLLQKHGCRIDAVGFQAHWGMTSPTHDQLESALKKVEALGIQVNISEFDLSPLPNPYEGADIAHRFELTPQSNPYTAGLPKEVEKKWEARVMSLFNQLMQHRSHIGRITFWGLSDLDSWKNGFPINGRTDYALFYDRQCRPKHVIELMKEALCMTR